jgi:hypothetical protein
LWVTDVILFISTQTDLRCLHRRWSKRCGLPHYRIIQTLRFTEGNDAAVRIPTRHLRATTASPWPAAAACRCSVSANVSSAADGVQAVRVRGCEPRGQR